MPGTVHLVCGDLFDGPADIVVLPCSTAGTFTPLVAQKLAKFSIPEPMPMPLGAVQILPLEDATHLAQFAAFAASVQAYSSTPAAIRQIGESLGQATQRSPGIRIINAPLLGAGAGKLQSEVVVEHLRKGFLSEAVDGGVLNIYVLHENVYRRVLSNLATVIARQTDGEVPGRESFSDGGENESGHGPPDDAPIRVLISYTSNSPEQAQWVEDLYTFLRGNGVDARLDTRSVRYGMDVVQWMCNELALADRVLLICDERYAKRADRRHGGVGWEIMIVQGDLFASMYGASDRKETAKYIPIVRTEDIEEGRPTFLATKRVLHWPPTGDAEKCRRDLLRDLYFERVPADMPLGPPPVRL